MTQQINGTVRGKLINCDTHFDNDQIEAVMRVIDKAGFLDMYEALKELMVAYGAIDGKNGNSGKCWDMARQALAEAESK